MTANVTEKASADDLIAKQREYLWPCVATLYAQPLVLERGEGMHVWDSEGNRYLDCFGGVLTTSVGHARPEVVEAVSSQVAAIAHTSTLYINRPQAELAEKLAQITPGRLKKSFFTNSGTEADETAMVLARIYTGNTEIIALRHAYHGRSIMNMTATGHAPWKHAGSSVAGIVHAHAPYCYRCPFNLKPESCALECARDVEELIMTSTSGQVAAFIAEPIMGVGGYITPPKDYFKVVTEIIRRYGGIFICDEVQTGWGRTGDARHRALGSGARSDDLAKGMANSSSSAYHRHTNSPTNIRVLRFRLQETQSHVRRRLTIRVIEENDLTMLGLWATTCARTRVAKGKFPVIGDVRGMGLMQAIECVKDCNEGT
jgi:4-aminobutyrate aminotransferase